MPWAYGKFYITSILAQLKKKILTLDEKPALSHLLAVGLKKGSKQTNKQTNFSLKRKKKSVLWPVKFCGIRKWMRTQSFCPNVRNLLGRIIKMAKSLEQIEVLCGRGVLPTQAFLRTWVLLGIFGHMCLGNRSLHPVKIYGILWYLTVWYTGRETHLFNWV